MILQCFDCVKKYSLNTESIPPSGVFATCSGCGQKLPIVLRDNADKDQTSLPLPKQKQKPEVKWNQRVVNTIKDWGYKLRTKEANVLYYVFREFRKKYGATFFDTACKVEVRFVDREMIYNHMVFTGDACIPATYEEVVSGLPRMLFTLADAIRYHDGGAYNVRDVLRIPYRDSFPTLFSFHSEALFQNAEGDQVRGLVSEVTLSLDALKALDKEPAEADIPSFARVEMSRAPIDNAAMPFKDRSALGLAVRSEEAPGLRLSDQGVNFLINEYARMLRKKA